MTITMYLFDIPPAFAQCTYLYFLLLHTFLITTGEPTVSPNSCGPHLSPVLTGDHDHLPKIIPGIGLYEVV